MPEFRAGSPAQVAYLDALMEAGLLAPTGVHGLYARGGLFERVPLANNRSAGGSVRRVSLVGSRAGD